MKWCDATSWDLIYQVALKATHLVFVITMRPISNSVYKNLLQCSGVHHLKLQRLTRDEIGQVLCQNLGVQSIPPKLLDVVMAKAQGNPFLAEQIATTLKEQEMFKIVFSQIVMEADVDLSKVSIPDTIQDVMLSRIDRYIISSHIVIIIILDLSQHNQQF